MSRSYALVTIVNARLGQHPKRMLTQEGQEVASFNAAYEDGFGKNTKIIWVACTAYGVQAKLCNRYLFKGACITMTGRLSLQEWSDKEGNMRSKIHVTIEHVVFNDQNSKGQKNSVTGTIDMDDIDAFDRYEQGESEQNLQQSVQRKYKSTEQDFHGGDNDSPPPPPFNPPVVP